MMAESDARDGYSSDTIILPSERHGSIVLYHTLRWLCEDDWMYSVLFECIWFIYTYIS